MISASGSRESNQTGNTCETSTDLPVLGGIVTISRESGSSTARTSSSDSSLMAGVTT